MSPLKRASPAFNSLLQTKSCTLKIGFLESGCGVEATSEEPRRLVGGADEVCEEAGAVGVADGAEDTGFTSACGVVGADSNAAGVSCFCL